MDNGKIYECNKCSYQATCQGDLSHHNIWIHKLEYKDGDKEIQYVDEDCDFDYEDDTEL